MLPRGSWPERLIRLLFGLLTLAIVLLLVIAGRPWETIPTVWNPWAPLAIDHPLNPVTRWKLARHNDDRDLCLQALASAPSGYLNYLPLEDHIPVAGCPLENVVRVRHSGVTFNAGFVATCSLLVRWTMFERQALQPLAAYHFDAAVDAVEHYGSFSCRNIYGRENARLSEHASASALDLAAFTLDDGTTIKVLDHWTNDSAPHKQAFLRDVHRAACNYFGTVLGPEYNQAHSNHFHLDTRRFGICR